MDNFQQYRWESSRGGLRERQISTLLLLTLAVLLSSVFSTDASKVSCDESSQCEKILRPGSQCINNTCSNPFYHGGCLKSLLPDQWNKTRVCNSQDNPEAERLGYCRSSTDVDYEEVRILARDWETNLFGGWINQILLSEILDVPTSSEAGSPDVNLNFYEPNSFFDFAESSTDIAFSGFETAARVKDCRKVTTSRGVHKYEPCYHINPEWWWGDYPDKSVFKGIEPVRSLGVFGELALYVPLFAAKMDPTLVSYIGLSGEENRAKLASYFKTPTRWKEFCDQISPTQCQVPDATSAMRPPETETEASAFFVEGLYNGYFRDTEKHNCTKYPDSCTGDFIQVRCRSTSYARQQFYHLGIALESRGPEVNGGYSYTEQAEIIRASNATKSPMLIAYYNQDKNYARFIGTEAELTRVLFPTPTQECVDARIDFRYQCDRNATLEQLVGKPEGDCDTFPQVLQKGVSLGFREICFSEDVEEEFWSPAYGAFEKYTVTGLQYNRIFDLWRQRSSDPGFDPRDAVCQWVVENLDHIKSFVPPTYPRVVEEANRTNEALFKVATGIAITVAITVVISMLVAFHKRKTKVFYYTQTEFLFPLLFGMLLVSASAAVLSIPSSERACNGLSNWLLNIGYVFQLIPLFARITAINKLVTSGKQMHRVRLRPVEIYAYVALVLCLVGGFLVTWEVMDPPEEKFEYQMTNRTTADDYFVIEATGYCGSESSLWQITVFAWLAAVLVPSCMVAFLASRVKEDLNDTRAMSLTLFSHVLFILLLSLNFAVFSANASKANLEGYASLILSGDTLFSLATYVFPKFLDSGETIETEPLPDVFVKTSLALLTVEGFTAWSSVREPVMVFQFLEELYGNLDQLAEKFGVYKVETIGETYVAATGIPDPQPDHFVRMARFVSACNKKMAGFVKRMEMKFGPDTGDLTLRIGMHSGPVTGGFLKGKGARFQLFGDTVSTANLIHGNGLGERIHVSEAAAELLINAGRKKWVLEREERVRTLEKGDMKTYWLVKGKHNTHLGNDASSFHASSVADSDSEDEEFNSMRSEERWIEWNVEIFKNLLKQILAARDQCSTEFFSRNEIQTADMPLDEVKEIIELPKFDRRTVRRVRENENVEVSPKALRQLKQFISEIADRYNDNPFHNFAHASYVVMAVTKYMNRIIAASEANLGEGDDRFRSSVQAAIHAHTYGITGDPLTQFACVFSALIHDVDHPGVPNPRLIQEEEEVAMKYKNRSVAEQKSLDIAWNMLMQKRFADLLASICHNPGELRRFRALVVNMVMATDLGDKQLKELRNGRWEKAFAQCDTSTSESLLSTAVSSSTDEEIAEAASQDEQINRKATIVVEHLIQAADVAHMSQHWSIYRKWNEKLFRELYLAYRTGRSENNPADNWYKGEIGFFDFYIIPLSRKLRDCGVFGPTSDENLNYATNNRNTWVKEGEAITKEMLKRVESEYPTNDTYAEDAEQPQPK